MLGVFFSPSAMFYAPISEIPTRMNLFIGAKAMFVFIQLFTKDLVRKVFLLFERKYL